MRRPAGFEASKRYAIPETCANLPAPLAISLTPCSTAARRSAPLTSSNHRLVVEGKLRPDVAPGQDRAGGRDLVGADAATVDQGDVGAGGRAHGVGDQVGDAGLAAAHHAAPAVERHRGGADLDVELFRQTCKILFHHRLDLGVRRHRHGVDDAKRRLPDEARAVPPLDGAHHDLDDGDELRLLPALDEGRLRADLDLHVVVIAREQQIDRALTHQRRIFGTVGMGEGDDQIRSRLAQLLRLLRRDPRPRAGRSPGRATT